MKAFSKRLTALFLALIMAIPQVGGMVYADETEEAESVYIEEEEAETETLTGISEAESEETEDATEAFEAESEETEDEAEASEAESEETENGNQASAAESEELSDTETEEIAEAEEDSFYIIEEADEETEVVSEAASADEITSTDGDLTWVYDEDTGTLTISGTGSMSSYSNGSQPWADYQDCIQTIEIENGVENIGSYAFYGCSVLTSVTIPDSVTTIESGTFYGCTSLTEVTIPDGVTSIGDNAFRECTKLSTINVTDVYAIDFGDSVFYQCPALADDDGFVIVADILFDYYGDEYHIAIPDTVSTISKYALGNVDEDETLVTVIVPESVTEIGSYAFYVCDYCRIVFEGSIPDMGKYAFSSATLTVYYPADDETWTEDVMTEYGGTPTYISYEAGATPWYDDMLDSAVEITDDGTYTASVNMANTQYALFTFTPEASGYYRLMPPASSSRDVAIFDADWKLVDEYTGYFEYKQYEGLHITYLEAGQTYVIACTGNNLVKEAVEVTDITETGTGTALSVSTSNGVYTYYEYTAAEDDAVYQLKVSGGSGVKNLLLLDSGATRIMYGSVSSYSSFCTFTNIGLEAGETYYLVVVSDTADEEFTMTVTAYNLVDITGEGEYTVTATDGYGYFRFTPSETGWYSIYHTDGYTNSIYIYDEDWDSVGSLSSLTVKLTAGETYYLRLSGSGVTYTLAVEKFDLYGSCGENVSWSYNDAGTLTISGTGEMTDYEDVEAYPWFFLNEEITTIMVPLSRQNF